jgi:hypothetical protein
LVDELRLGETLGLHLPGHDQPAGIGDDGLEILAGEEYQGSFDDGEHQRQERRCDQREFDRRGAVLAGQQSPHRRRSGDCAQPANNSGADGPQHAHCSGSMNRENFSHRAFSKSCPETVARGAQGNISLTIPADRHRP